MSGHCPGCGAYCEEDEPRLCSRCTELDKFSIGMLVSALRRRARVFIAVMDVKGQPNDAAVKVYHHADKGEEWKGLGLAAGLYADVNDATRKQLLGKAVDIYG